MNEIFIINRYFSGGGHVTTGRGYESAGDRDEAIMDLKKKSPEDDFVPDKLVVGERATEG